MSTRAFKLLAASVSTASLIAAVFSFGAQQNAGAQNTSKTAQQNVAAPSSSTLDTVAITIDAQADRRAINSLIYGVAHASTQQLTLLNAPLNRSGGNNTSRYNWKLNADNRGNDWFFQSIGDDKAEPAERADSFIARSKAAGAQPMWTIPLLDWVAKIGPNREKLASYSVAKYGAQQKTDQYMADAGNGLKPDGSHIEGNDPADANTRNSPEFQQEFVKHLVRKWGTAAKGGLRYYIMDNEPALWNGTHRDVQPTGITMQELVDKTIAYSNAVKAVDSGALVVGPEEWGWTGYSLSAYDSQQGAKLNWDRSKMPDRQKMGGMDALPWYPRATAQRGEKSGKRVLDVFTVHIYPQGGEFGDDVSRDMQLRRNRSTRALWDTNYKDETLDQRHGATHSTPENVGGRSLPCRHAHRHHGIQLGCRKSHQRCHGASRCSRHLWPRRSGHRRTLDNARHQYAHLQSDADVSQLRRQEERLRRNKRARDSSPIR
jgi:hypothetical protein